MMQKYCSIRSVCQSLKNNPDTRNVIFAGRLGAYRYFDMDKIVELAFELAHKENLFVPRQ